MKAFLYIFVTSIVSWTNGIENNINLLPQIGLDHLTNFAILNNLGKLSDNSFDINNLRNGIIKNYNLRNGLNRLPPTNVATPTPPTTTPLPASSAEVVTLGKTGTMHHETPLLPKTPHYSAVPIQQQSPVYLDYKEHIPVQLSQHHPQLNPIILDKPFYIRVPYPVVVPQRVEVKVPVPVYIRVSENRLLLDGQSPLPFTPLPFGQPQFIPGHPQLIANQQQVIPGIQQLIRGTPQFISNVDKQKRDGQVGLNSVSAPLPLVLPPVVEDKQKSTVIENKRKRNGEAGYGLLISHIGSRDGGINEKIRGFK